MKNLIDLETKKYLEENTVCGIDDRAVNCEHEICDRLMSPITGRHIEPVCYKFGN